MRILKLAAQQLREKLNESLSAVLPVLAIVLALCFTVAPLPIGTLVSFLLGAALLVAGMVLFNMGADLAMTPMGERMGASLARSRSVPLVLAVAFALGFVITISEPDLQVLANQVPAVPNLTLVLAVAAGVGGFLVVALGRMLLGISLRRLLVAFYLAVFALALFVPADFLCVAFDSGGVTTGPMTVPFIMALGVGVSAIRDDRHAASDSFGLVALCSIGPILAVLVLGMVYAPQGDYAASNLVPQAGDSAGLFRLFAGQIPHYMAEIAAALAPIVGFFLLFQLAVLRLPGRQLARICVGLLYTFTGLVLFLTGVNVGFLPAGYALGGVLAGLPWRWALVPVAMAVGFFIVRAEPAVYVLNKQVEEMTDGAISAGAMGTALSVGMALSLGLAMVRVITGISILWFLIPGYAVALGISFFVPKIYTAIAFDSGGVASGPMTATFLLPLAQGACTALGGNVVTDAFGVVAMVAMAPLITIQLMGVAARVRTAAARQASLRAQQAFRQLDEDAIIEL